MTAYLHPSTISKVVKKLEEVLIRDQLEIIHAAAKDLIHDEKMSGEDLIEILEKIHIELFRTKPSLSYGESHIK